VDVDHSLGVVAEGQLPVFAGYRALELVTFVDSVHQLAELNQVEPARRIMPIHLLLSRLHIFHCDVALVVLDCIDVVVVGLPKRIVFALVHKSELVAIKDKEMHFSCNYHLVFKALIPCVVFVHTYQLFVSFFVFYSCAAKVEREVCLCNTDILDYSRWF